MKLMARVLDRLVVKGPIAHSSITLADGAGKAVAAGKAKVDADTPAILHLEVPALSSGAYSVTWAAAGHDGVARRDRTARDQLLLAEVSAE